MLSIGCCFPSNLTVYTYYAVYVDMYGLCRRSVFQSLYGYLSHIQDSYKVIRK